MLLTPERKLEPSVNVCPTCHNTRMVRCDKYRMMSMMQFMFTDFQGKPKGGIFRDAMFVRRNWEETYEMPCEECSL